MNAAPARGGAAVPLVGAPTVPAAPTPADKPATALGQTPARGFAELLRRNRAEAPKAAPAEPARRADAAVDAAEAASSGEVGATASIEAKAAPANAAKARAATPKAASERASVDAGDRAHEESDEPCRDDRAELGDPAPALTSPAERLEPSPAAAPALDALRRLGPPCAAERNDTSGSGGEERPATAMAGATMTHGLGHARGMASVDTANERPAAAIDAARDAALAIAADARVQAESGATKALDRIAAMPARERTVDAMAASLGVGMPIAGADPAAATAPAAALALSTPIESPDFAAALGVRVSLLVADGVQQAELHLNPAETGPVSIHITLDGTAARVDFGADLAATRAVIERGLPELASALRDAGFTLAGGGVSQHAGGRASGDDDASRSGARLDGGSRPGAASIAADPRRAVRTVAAGGIDLYA